MKSLIVTAVAAAAKEMTIYKVLEKKMTWYDAAEACRELGGMLAHPENAQENAQILQIIKGNDDTWMGASEEVGSRKWTWQNGTPLKEGYQNWYSAEPSNDSISGRDCGHFWYTNG